MTQAWVSSIDCSARDFRDMLGSFMTGVTVVATRDLAGDVRAFTANSFTSVSIDPPLVLVCLAKTSASYDTFLATEAFSISVLADDQRDTSNAFASRSAAAKAEAATRLAAEDEVPYVENGLAAIICARDRVIDAGDHIILLGLVRRFRSRAGLPLCYFRGSYVGFGLAVRELEPPGGPLIIGGLLAHGGRVLLCRRPGRAHWELPSSPLAAHEPHGELLRSLFARLGIAVEVSLPYSLFREIGEHWTTLIFSLETNEEVMAAELDDGTEIGLFGDADRPWEMVAGEMKSGMLLRYFRERASGNFGMYFDTSDGGRVVPLSGDPQRWAEWRTNLFF